MEMRLPFWLTILCTAPFVLLSMSIAFGWTSNPTQSLHLLIMYAAILFSFLGGIHWGIAIRHLDENPKAATLMIAESMVAPLCAWLIMFIDETYIQLLSFAFLYALIWGIDSILYNNKIIPLWFFNLRGILTPIVVVSMYVAYFSVI